MTLADIMIHWPTMLTAIGGLGAGGILKTALDHRRRMRAATDEVVMGLVGKLSDKIDRMEAAAKTDRERMDAEMRQERLYCEARLAVQRHKFNNLDMSFDGLLRLYRVAPDKAADIIDDIMAQRQRQRVSEAAESASVMQAVLAAAGVPAPID